MFCIKCGQQNEGGAKFCQKCGQPLPTASQQPVPPNKAPKAAAPQLPQGKSKKIAVSAFTKGGRAKEGERLTAKYIKKGWVFVRFEEGGMGKTFAHFVIPATLKKPVAWGLVGAVPWWVIGAVVAFVAVFAWLGFSSAFPVPMMLLNGALVIGAMALIKFVRRRRRGGAGATRAIASLVGVFCFAILGFVIAWASQASVAEQERAAAEQARHEAKGREQLYGDTLAAVGALSARVQAEPVTVYQEANGALQLFAGKLRGEAKYQQLKTDSLALIEKTKRPFAAHRLEQARQHVAEKQYVQAKAAVDNALRLDPELQEAKNLQGQVSEQAARQVAEEAVAPVLAQAKEDMGIAKKYAGSKEYIAADTLLAGILPKLDAVPEHHRKYVNMGSARRAVERQKKGIASRVKKQKAKEERERSEAAFLDYYCGNKPQQSAWDGEVLAATAHMEKTAHDPDSIEVKNCTAPQFSKKSCWVTTCEVRGRNAFGGLILNRVRFAIGRHPSIEGFGQVISATNL